MALKAELKKLYPEQWPDVYRRWQKLIAEFRAQYPQLAKQRPEPFSQKDIILSCYPDQVFEANVSTLCTLAKFLRTYVPFIKIIHLLPFYPASGDDGFAVVDYFKVDKKFGSWANIRSLAKNYDLMFDVVLNHCSDQNVWFQKFLAADKKYQNYFIAFNRRPKTSSVFRPRLEPVLRAYQTVAGRKYVWSTFPLSQVDFNFANPEVLLDFLGLILFYVGRGAKFLRLDAVAYLAKQLGTTCFNLPAAHSLVKIIRQTIESAAPNVKMAAEVVAGQQQNISWWGAGDEAHLIYNFALEPLLALTLIEQNSALAYHYLRQLKYPNQPNASYLNLTISHDGIHTVPAQDIIPARQWQVLDKHIKKRGGQVLYRRLGRQKKPYEFNATYLSVLGDWRAFLASQTIQLALRGLPFIYFNNLIGALNWTAGFKKTGQGRSLNRQKFNFQSLTKKLGGSGRQAKIFRQYSHLIRRRQAEPLFSPLAGQKLINFGPDLLAIRRGRGQQRLLSLTNVTAKPISIKADLVFKALGRGQAQDLISGQKLDFKQKPMIKFSPYQSLWLK